MFAQVQELLTNYGKIDIIWFDGSWERSPEQWQAQKIHDLIRSLQPEILINDRLPGFGDFTTPEHFMYLDHTQVCCISCFAPLRLCVR